MTADNDILHLEDIDGKLHDRKTIEVSMDDDIGHVAVDKYLSRSESEKLFSRDAAV
jgi:hypothetical protein